MTVYEPGAPKRGLSGKVIGGIIAAVLVAALGVGGFIAYKTLFQAKQDIPKLLAGDTQLYASINPNLSALKGGKNLQDAFKNLTASSEADSGKDTDQQMADALGVNFKDDMQPWIGTEMAVAVSGFENFSMDAASDGDELAKQAKLVIILATRDKVKSEAFLQKLRAKQQDDGAYTDETYKGVKIAGRARDAAKNDNPVNALATFQDYVLIANDAQLIKDLVDRSASQQNTLGQNPRFQSVIGGLPTTAIGYLYVDGTAVSKGVDAAMKSSDVTLSDEQQTQVDKSMQVIRALEGIGMSISLPDQGLAFDFDTKLDMSKLDADMKAQLDVIQAPVGAEILSTVGQDALASITGLIPSTFKKTVMDGLNASPDVKEQLKEFEEQTGLNLETDLLDWFQGPFGLVVMPADKEKFPNIPASGYFRLRTTAKDKAQAGMKKIEDAIDKMSNGSTAFSDSTLGGQSWRVIKDPDAGVAGGYGFVGDDFVLGIGEELLTNVPAGATTPLVNDANFKAVQANLPAKNSGIVFFNVPKIVETVAKFQDTTADELYKSDGGKAVKPIRGVGMAGEPGLDATGLGKARLFILVTPDETAK